MEDYHHQPRGYPSRPPQAQGFAPPYSPGAYVPQSAPAPQSFDKPHRGGMILAFGLLGFMACFVFAFFAWFMGKRDLADMRAGRMDPSGKSLTEIGYWLGLVCAILNMVSIPIFVGLWLLIATRAF